MSDSSEESSVAIQRRSGGWLVAAGVLLGLGLRQLSVTPSAIPEIKTNVWPAFPTDLTSPAITVATQSRGSVLFHELGHSMVALRYKIRVVSITLFIFGGMARIAKEAERPMQEFNIAIAGPAASFLLAAVFFGIALPFSPNSMVGVTCLYLAEINALLAVFNLVPGMPLDGGRILRAIAWAMTKNPNKATRLASRSGQFLAYLLIMAGIMVSVQSGHWLDGLWWIFIGWFLLSAAQQSYAQVELRRVLDGLHAADVMSEDLPTIDRTLSLEDYLHEVLRTGRRWKILGGTSLSEDRLGRAADPLIRPRRG